MLVMLYKTIFTIILIVFTHLTCFGSEAFDDIIEEIIPTTKLTKDQLLTLKKEMGIQKLFIEGVKKIELRGGEFVDIERSRSTLQDLLVDSMNAKADNLPAEAKRKFQDIVKEGFNKNTLTEILKGTRDKAYSFARGKKVYMSSIVRRFGFDVGLVYLLSSQVDFTFPMYMVANGHTAYGVLLATPITSLTVGTYAAIKSAVKYRQVVKGLGGMSIAKEHLNVFKRMKNYFGQNLLRKYDLFDIFVGKQSYALTIEKRNLMTKVMRKLGWSQGINYENIISYMDDNNLMPKLVEKMKTSDLHPTSKLIRILAKIEQSNDEEVFHKIREKFGKYINEISSLPEFSTQRQWVMKIMDSKSFDHFIKLLGKMPNDIPPAIFDSIWRNKIILSSQKSINHYTGKNEYVAFRKLSNDYDKELRGILANSTATDLSASQRKLFADYVFDSLAGVGICQNLFKRKSENFVPFL